MHSVMDWTSHLIGGGKMPARTYRSSVVGRIYPVTHLHVSFRAISTFLAWQDLVQTGLVYSVAE